MNRSLAALLALCDFVGVPPRFAGGFANSFVRTQLAGVEAAIEKGKPFFVTVNLRFEFDANTSFSRISASHGHAAIH